MSDACKVCGEEWNPQTLEETDGVCPTCLTKEFTAAKERQTLQVKEKTEKKVFIYGRKTTLEISEAEDGEMYLNVVRNSGERCKLYIIHLDGSVEHSRWYEH
jgi:hypothetical protein